jgi:hypothetical protein
MASTANTASTITPRPAVQLAPDAVLLENGFYILLENGGRILLEAG